MLSGTRTLNTPPKNCQAAPQPSTTSESLCEGQPHEHVPRHHRGEDQRVHRPPPTDLRVLHHAEAPEGDLVLHPGSPSATRTVPVRRPKPHRSTANRCNVRYGTTTPRRSSLPCTLVNCSPSSIRFRMSASTGSSRSHAAP